MTSGKVLEISACFLMAAGCLDLCNSQGHLYTPAWISWTLIILPALFWATVLSMTFIVWVLFTIRKVDNDIREKENNCDEEENW